jgi:hypothetical protein
MIKCPHRTNVTDATMNGYGESIGGNIHRQKRSPFSIRKKQTQKTD